MTRLIDEAQLYEAARAKLESCRVSTVQPVNCIVLNGAPHSGVVSHVCDRTSKHPDSCKCRCGYQWRGK